MHKTSIFNFNRYIISSFIIINLGLVVFMIEYAPRSEFEWVLALIMLLNLGMLFLYTAVNARYWREHERLFMHFTSFIREKKKPEGFPTEEEFDENAKFLSLFKRTYIEQNILKKDYNDFRKVFDMFIPKEIHTELGFRGYERIVLGAAEKKNLTIMFLDIMRFTAVSESIDDPYRALLLLNIYFDGIGDIIYRHKGYIDKYLGDGILAIFDRSDSDEAIQAAVEIQEFIKKFQDSAFGKHIEIGIGINTGEVIMGTIGTKKRMDATVIGDVVNVAARLQSMTRESESKILISQETKSSLKQTNSLVFHDMGKTVLKGKKSLVWIYGVDVNGGV